MHAEDLVGHAISQLAATLPTQLCCGCRPLSSLVAPALDQLLSHTLQLLEQVFPPVGACLAAGKDKRKEAGQAPVLTGVGNKAAMCECQPCDVLWELQVCAAEACKQPLQAAGGSGSATG
jgi:hypothetical protein